MRETDNIFKSKLTERFTAIPNDVLQRCDLSARAKGLLCYILSLPSNWIIRKSELTNHFTEGRDALQKAFKELENNGYILSVEIRDENGKFQGKNFIVYDTPQTPLTENPSTVNPSTVNPSTVNPQLQKKHIKKETYTKETNNTISILLDEFLKSSEERKTEIESELCNILAQKAKSNSIVFYAKCRSIREEFQLTEQQIDDLLFKWAKANALKISEYNNDNHIQNAFFSKIREKLYKIVNQE